MNIFEPGKSYLIKLYLRRTLVRSDYTSAILIRYVKKIGPPWKELAVANL